MTSTGSSRARQCRAEGCHARRRDGGRRSSAARFTCWWRAKRRAAGRRRSGRQVAGVAKVLLADDAAYGHALAENIAPLVVGLMGNYSAFVAPATTRGKNIAPRVAALLDVVQISEILSVEGPDTFTRPIYAGNAIATVTSSRCEEGHHRARDGVRQGGGDRRKCLVSKRFLRLHRTPVCRVLSRPTSPSWRDPS